MSHLPKEITLEELEKMDNIANILSKESLVTIGSKVKEEFDIDNQSRAPWYKMYEEAMKVAAQVIEKKTSPWENASNVKYPILTIAALAFHARAYPMLLPSKGIVYTKILNAENEEEFNEKYERAMRVQSYMNFQIYEDIPDWDENMDKLLITLPITGSEFKKTYYDSAINKVVSEYVPAKDLVVNYHATSLETAERKTQIFNMNSNSIREMINLGLYKEPEVEAQPISREDKTTQVSDKIQGKENIDTASTNSMFLESHTFLDLDGDGYAEPYIVTIEHSTSNVYRIVSRFKKIEYNDGFVVKIEPEELYIHYKFIPSPDGGFYGIGFGMLLGSLNHAVNTLINQIIDSGTVYNLPAGFISKHFRIAGGNYKFKPGEWKFVNAAAQDIKNGVIPLPAREPSLVLFQLLNLLITAGERLTSTTDMFVGENPGQNQKATTTQAVLEQGQKVYTAIYKRIRNILGKEFKKIYEMDGKYLDKKKYYAYFDIDSKNMLQKSIAKEDFEDRDLDVLPTADPNAVSHSTKIERAQMYIQMAAQGILDMNAATMRFLEAVDEPNPQELLPQPNPVQEEMVQRQFQKDDLDKEVQIREQLRKEQETEIKRIQAMNKKKFDDNTQMITAFKTGAEVAKIKKESNENNKSRVSGVERKSNK